VVPQLTVAGLIREYGVPVEQSGRDLAVPDGGAGREEHGPDLVEPREFGPQGVGTGERERITGHLAECRIGRRPAPGGGAFVLQRGDQVCDAPGRLGQPHVGLAGGVLRPCLPYQQGTTGTGDEHGRQECQGDLRGHGETTRSGCHDRS
jgi:hypothetical protein